MGRVAGRYLRKKNSQTSGDESLANSSRELNSQAGKQIDRVAKPRVAKPGDNRWKRNY